jgi:branched-chain amino acid aminotransferase
LTLCEELGYEIEERALTVDEVLDGIESGRLTEAFGAGTAVVISPVAEFTYRERTVVLNGGETGVLTQKLYDTLTGIQYGRLEDTHGWVEVL